LLNITADELAARKARPFFRSNQIRGRWFDASRADSYPVNQLYVNGPKGRVILDSYNPFANCGAGEIISRKFTQLADIKPETARAYTRELVEKSPPGSIIEDVPSAQAAEGLLQSQPVNLIGQPLKGRLVLEVPQQLRPIPPEVLDEAARNGVLIR